MIYNEQNYRERLEKRFGQNYDFSNTVFINGKTNVTIRCKKHGEIIKKPYYLMANKIPCDKCKFEHFKTTSQKYSFDKEYFSSISSSEKAYWLGFIWGDGCLKKANGKYRSLCIGLARKDENHLKKFKLSIQSEHPISKERRFGTNGKIYRASRLSITSLDLSRDLIKLGFLDRNIPNNLPDYLFFDFVRGLHDSDGSFTISCNKEVIQFMGNKDLLQWVSSGLKTKLNLTANPTIRFHRGIYVFCIFRKQAVKVLKSLYDTGCDIFLDRKVSKYKNLGVLTV